MKSILSDKSRDVLARLTTAQALLAFDFDGTLAPIVAHPDDAHMREETATLFNALCLLYPCVVITGRGRADVAARLGDARVKHIVGNHGLEPGSSLSEYAEQMNEARRILELSLRHTSGVELEYKRYSIALHYRRANQKRTAREAIQRAVASLPTLVRVVPGKLVINLVPEHAPNKGEALLSLLTTENADVGLYVGDDVTDEDVFKLNQPERLLTIRVGRARNSAAAYYVHNQAAIESLLRRLVELRQASESQ